MKPIDFVVTWVDGDDPEHKKKREAYVKLENAQYLAADEYSAGEARYVQHNELKYCLRSIKQYAPWYRKIWLVTDQQFPAFLNRELIHLDRIEVVDHQDIFSDYEHCLPTFNSQSIECLVWRIKGLSENFLLANDDFMFSGSVSRHNFFFQDKTIVYGDWTKLDLNLNLTTSQKSILKSVAMIGYDSNQFIRPGHCFYSLNKYIFEDIFENHKTDFINNITFRFRDPKQFQPVALFSHYCIKNDLAQVVNTEKIVLFDANLCKLASSEKIEMLLGLLQQQERTMFCINDFQSLHNNFPDLFQYLDSICGSPLISEIR